jgi:hypothetical protein
MTNKKPITTGTSRFDLIDRENFAASLSMITRQFAAGRF